MTETVAIAVATLFEGDPWPMGGLSNEKELAAQCPKEFYEQTNEWSNFAMKIFFKGARIENWEWKATEYGTKVTQSQCLHGLLGTFNLPHQDKRAVAGWMLSEMLAKVPEHIPGSQ